MFLRVGPLLRNTTTFLKNVVKRNMVLEGDLCVLFSLISFCSVKYITAVCVFPSPSL